MASSFEDARSDGLLDLAGAPGVEGVIDEAGTVEELMTA
jgi:hypothetical protein